MADGPKNWSIRQLFGRFGLALVNASGADIEALGETDGKFMASLYGKAGATSTAIGVEATTGEVKVVNYGKDSGGTIDPLLTDDDKKLWVRTTDFSGDDDDPVTLSNAADTTIYTVAAGFAAELYVEFTNIDTAARTLDLYCDPTGTDVTTAFQLLNDYSVLPNSLPVRLGPYNVGAAGTVRARASAATAINARVFVRLRRTT